MISRITKVRKRDGRLVEFDEAKIADAVHKAGVATGREDRFLAEELAGVVTLFLEKNFAGRVPGIEDIQDMVEKVLIETGHARLAKAYILYRERRARAREVVRVEQTGGLGEAAGPVVGSPVRGRLTSWSKARITDALSREADLDTKVAAQVAASVERRIMERGVERVTTSVIRSLVEAELFDRGFQDRVGRQALIGLPRFDLDALVRGKRHDGWRADGPAPLRRAVSNSVLAQYALSEIYGEDVVDAHLGARLHVLDVGSPFEWAGAAIRLDRSEAGDGDAWVTAIARRIGRLGPLVTRELLVEDAAPEGLEWAGSTGARGAMASARRLLSHTALETGNDAAGFRVVLSAGLPDEPDSLAEALVREHWARFRSGRVQHLPELVLRVPAARIDEAGYRTVMLPVLAAAAETGRILVAWDRDDAVLASSWYRLPAPERSGTAAMPIASAVAVNLGALAGRSEDDLLEALDQLLVLAVKAAKQKRTFLAALAADPAAPLYRVAAGARPVLPLGKGYDLVHLVGVRAAADRLAAGAAGAARLAGRLRSYASVRLAEEGRAVRLRVAAAPDRDGEAGRRFAAVARPDDPEPHVDTEGYALPPELCFHEVEARLEPSSGTLTLRFPREAAPAPEALYDAACLLARDPRVDAVRLAPWPDRSVLPPRRSGGENPGTEGPERTERPGGPERPRDTGNPGSAGGPK